MSEVTQEHSETTILSDSAIQNQYMIFELADERYGVEILKVQTIISYDEPSHVPNTPEFMKGVINLRGDVIPIIDMRLRFGLEPVEYDETTVVIVVEIDEKKYGLIVDAVSDVKTIAKEDVQTNVDLQTNIDSSYIQGIGKLEEQMIILVDIVRVFSKDEIEEITKQVS